MTLSRTAAAFTLASVLAVPFAAGCAAESEWSDDGEETGDSSEAVTGGRIVAKQFGSPGKSINKWGYDIKQDGRSQAMKPALAKEIFVDTGMNLLRIAVRASVAHPSRGVEAIKKQAYQDDLDAINIVRAARPDVAIFASLKLLAEDTFPGWVKSGGSVDADDYSVLLENYLVFMKQNGVTVDFLGVDCEQLFNKGGITPAKYNKIVSNVRDFCKANGIKVPSFIAPEDYGPVQDTAWLKDLAQTSAGFSNVDNVGVHLYSKHRDPGYVDAIEALARNDHGKGLWDTEFHWNDLDEDKATEFNEVKPGMLLAMDHFDAGFTSMTWWAFQPRSKGTKSAQIMSELVESTIGASTLPTDDMDGVAATMNKFNSRAFRKGAKEVVLWVANYDKGQKGQWTEIANQTVASASYVQWSPTSPIGGVKGSAKVVAKNKSCFAMDFPANTITRVSVTLK